MNDPSTLPPTDEETPAPAAVPVPSMSQIEDLIRRYPAAAALTAIGFGCAFGIVARELMTPPPPPKHRALQLLEDIQRRLAAFAEPAYERASHLADDGACAVKRGLHSVGDSKLGGRLSRLFS